MKLSRRSISLLVCLLMATTLTVAGTVAYLTDTAEVTNTFTVGKVQIELDEEVVTPDGEPVIDPDTGDPERTAEGNSYHLIPGKEFPKDPTTTVKAGSETSHVRMLVTITQYPALTAAFEAHGKTFAPGEWVTGYDGTKWIAAGSSTDENGDLVLEYRYFETVSTMDEPQTDKVLEPLFTDFTVPGFLTGDDMATIEGMEIKVRSEAMQAEGFADADAAWAAFEEVTASDNGTDGGTDGGSGETEPGSGEDAPEQGA